MDEKEIKFYKDQADNFSNIAYQANLKYKAYCKAWELHKPSESCKQAYANWLGLHPKAKQ